LHSNRYLIIYQLVIKKKVCNRCASVQLLFVPVFCSITKIAEIINFGKLARIYKILQKNTFATPGRKEPGKKKIEPAFYPGLCFGSLSIIDNGAEY